MVGTVQTSTVPTKPTQAAPSSNGSHALLTELQAFCEGIAKPPALTGRGIVTCAGGLRYNICAWVLIRMLREVGCQLPIEVWYLGERERDPYWQELVAPYGVTCREVDWQGPGNFHPRAYGWASKSHAILHSAFEEVLFLDADNLPVVDPTYLFEEPAYQQTGAVFWSDGGAASPAHPLWRILNIPPRHDREFESGQMLIDKRRSWHALNVADWLNKRADFFYRYIYGDKDTFRLAWRYRQQEFAMPERGLAGIGGTLCQHDFQGRRVFQHRCHFKWSLRRNRFVEGCEKQQEAFAFLDELRQAWNPVRRYFNVTDAQNSSAATDELQGRRYRICENGRRQGRIELAAEHVVHHHPDYEDAYWWIQEDVLGLLLAGRAGPYLLHRQADGSWASTAKFRQRPRLLLTPS